MNKTAKNVQHLSINCPPSTQVSVLADLRMNCTDLIIFLVLTYGKDGKVLVFTQTKADANQLSLTEKIKMDVEVMHGDIA